MIGIKTWIGIFTLVLSLTHISSINSHIDNATSSFRQKKFLEASNELKVLVDSLLFNDSTARINLGSSYYSSKKYNLAYPQYKLLTHINQDKIASQGALMAGNSRVLKSMDKITTTPNDSEKVVLKEALLFYKQSLKKNPNNESARYNYELIKRILKEKAPTSDLPKPEQPKQKEDKKDDKKEDKKDQNKNQKNDPNKQQDQKDKNNSEQQNEKKEDQQKGDKKDQNKDSKKENESKNQKGENKEPNASDKKDEGKHPSNQQPENKNGKNSDDKKHSLDQKKQDPQELDQAQKDALKKEMQEKEMNRRLMKNNISKEKAEEILRSINQQQKKYIQQLPQKETKKSTDQKGPDW